MQKELEKQINTLVDLCVSNIMDNSITTFKWINNIKTQRRIAEQILSAVYKKCSMNINLYFKKNENG